MPVEDVDALDARYPGYVVARIDYHEGRINARLSKRYATPFVAPVPPIVQGWITDLVTLDCFIRRGFNPESAQDSLYQAAAEAVKAELLEAANSETGLFDLPLRADGPGASGVSKGAPLSYTEASPYVWMDIQRAAGRADDDRGSGL